MQTRFAQHVIELLTRFFDLHNKNLSVCLACSEAIDD